MARARMLLLFALVAGGCKIHRLPELPPSRDPVAAEAPVTEYTPPPDVLTTELSTGTADASDPHAGHHHGHGGAP